jgi:hypothetical protein
VGLIRSIRAFPITVVVTNASSQASARGFGLVLEAPLPPGTAGVTAQHPYGTANDRFAAELFGDLTGGGRIGAATLNRWARFLRHHRRGDLVATLLAGPVLRSLHARAVAAGGGSSAAALLNGYYRLFLDRDADAAGLAKKRTQLEAYGEAHVVIGLLSSPEYFSKTVL